jgi:hypothetical protein
MGGGTPRPLTYPTLPLPTLLVKVSWGKQGQKPRLPQKNSLILMDRRRVRVRVFNDQQSAIQLIKKIFSLIKLKADR